MSKIQIRKIGVLLSALFFACVSGCGNDTASYIELENKEIIDTQRTENITTEKETQHIEEEQLYVYVCGAVQNPGVYKLSVGSRICDAFEAAGGFSELAATDYWNQARLLTDGEMIYVPTIEEVEAGEVSKEMSDAKDQNAVAEDASGKVNINTASLKELMTVPGIGEAKAKAIIAYREQYGAFSTIEEIKKVEGIKEGVFEKIKEYIDIN